MSRVAVVPGTPLLLPGTASLVDPVPDLRGACRSAVAWLTEGGEGALQVLCAPVRPDNAARGVTVPLGERVAAALAPHSTTHHVWTPDQGHLASGVPTLVVANGSACRTEKAPGHLDSRAPAFDASLGQALLAGDTSALRALDATLGAELWCHDVPVLRALADAWAGPRPTVAVDYDDDPFGVQYWVVRWS